MNPANEQPTTERRPATPEQPGTRWARRARAIGLWARDTGLGITGFIVVLVVAISGWSASFIGLHQFGIDHMGFTAGQAWLVPITFDGAAAGLSLVVFRASIHGRSAALWRLLIVVFTGLSSWINYVHITDVSGRWIACYMPPSAVILFEGLMSEARAAYSRRGGKERPRVHPLRWVFDGKGTKEIYRSYVLGIELPEALQKAAVILDEDAPATATEAPQGAAPERPDNAPESAPVALSKRPKPTPQSVPVAPRTAATERPSTSLQSATRAPQRDAPERHESGHADAPKAPRKALPKRHPADPRGAAEEIIKALYGDLGRRPLESEMVAALIKAKCKYTSRQFANKVRAEIEKGDPALAALGTDNVRPLTGT